MYLATVLRVFGFLMVVFGLGMIGVTLVIASVTGGYTTAFKWLASVGLGLILYAVGEKLERRASRA